MLRALLIPHEKILAVRGLDAGPILLAGLGALASIATQRVATMIWRRAFGEEPPE